MSTANVPSTTISESKTAALSRVLDSIPKGYRYWMAGKVPARKAIRMLEKFHQQFGIGCSPGQRITRKQQGVANTLLVLYWPPEADTADWLLLATPGTGLESETVTDMTAKPKLVWLGYELTRHAIRGRVAWTWRRTKREMAEHYGVLKELLKRRHMGAVQDTLQRLAHQPGFHGVREQSRVLCEFAKAYGYEGKVPFLFHVQKVGHGRRLELGTRR